MSARFKIVLFVAMAAGIGLHLRPCIGCLIGGLLGGEACPSAPAPASAPAPRQAPTLKSIQADAGDPLRAASPAASTTAAATQVALSTSGRPGLSAFMPSAPPAAMAR